MTQRPHLYLRQYNIFTLSTILAGKLECHLFVSASILPWVGRISLLVIFTIVLASIESVEDGGAGSIVVIESYIGLYFYYLNPAELGFFKRLVTFSSDEHYPCLRLVYYFSIYALSSMPITQGVLSKQTATVNNISVS
jgi:hypothetical protein